MAYKANLDFVDTTLMPIPYLGKLELGKVTAELIESDNTGNAFAPQIAFDSNGNALAVWWQSDGSRHSIWANRFE